MRVVHHCIDGQEISEKNGLDKTHVVHCRGDDAPPGMPNRGDASRVVHQAHDRATMNIAGDVCVLRLHEGCNRRSRLGRWAFLRLIVHDAPPDAKIRWSASWRPRFATTWVAPALTASRRMSSASWSQKATIGVSAKSERHCEMHSNPAL